jgi:hypothetical protein
MADKKKQGDGGQDEFRSDDFMSEPGTDFGALTGGKSDSGLGNLPPLSDFDSDDASSKGSALGGLPPLSDIEMTTPMPTGGNIKPAPAGFPSGSSFDTPMSDPGLKIDTPMPPKKGASFQDLTADSDFSPETPEIGPGPDSDLETPMFDSAFGGADFSHASTPDTSSPTQAMETPMFGPAKPASRGQSVGFDDGAFGGDFLGGGTPAPDLSPDTGMGGHTPVTPAAVSPKEAKKAAKAARASGGGGGGGAKTALIAAILLVVGLLVGPFLAPMLSMIPYPVNAKLQQAEAERDKAKKDLANMAKIPGGDEALSEEEIAKRVAQQQELETSIKSLTEQKLTAETDTNAVLEKSKKVQQDFDSLTEQFVTEQGKYDELMNQTAIISARQEGLLAEVTRLQGMVGTLEDANGRQVATKDSLSSAVGRLEVLVREGIPLTPERYALDKRRAAVEALKQKVDTAKWVTPEMMEELIALYSSELSIAASHEYFFAKVPVADRFGSTSLKWAECLMNGNWSVYYRTLDGKNIGVYENVTLGGAASYKFREDFPSDVRNSIEETIFASRTPGYEDKLRVLVEKQLVTDPEAPFQKVFNSL